MAEIPRARPLLLLDAAAIAGFGALAVSLAMRVEAEAWWLVPVLLLPAIFLADVLSGLVHWWGDTFFDERTPILGPAVIHDFREHHDFPERMTTHGFLELNGSSCLVLVPPLAGVVAADLDGRAGAALDVFALCFALAAAATNHLHKWAHATSTPRWVAWAQGKGWILPPEHHALHHAPPHRRAYCVTTGWANRWLDRIDAFPRLERALRAIGS